MLKNLWILAIAVFVFAVSAPSWAADPPAASQPGPKAAEFNQVYTQWKKLLSEMRDLRSEYKQAAAPRRSEIEKRYGELISEGETLLPKLTQAAQDAFAESPADSQAQAEFLLSIIAERCGSDDYEEALRLARPLAEKGAGAVHDNAIGLGGIAAFAVGDFDLAEKWLNAAKAGQILDKVPSELGQLGQQFLGDIEYYKAAWKKEQEIRAAEAKADDLPRVLLKTNKGDIEIELFENEAPNSVANFISLVQKGFYNGVVFHRVLPQFMAQGGDPTGTGSGGPGYAIPCECYQPNHRIHFRGTLSMAHAGRDTGGSQFFLTFIPTHHLDGKHTAFGRVIKGMDVLAKIQRRNPEDAQAPTPDKIVQATVVRKRNHAYEPKTLPDPRPGR